MARDRDPKHRSQVTPNVVLQGPAGARLSISPTLGNPQGTESQRQLIPSIACFVAGVTWQRLGGESGVWDPHSLLCPHTTHTREESAV